MATTSSTEYSTISPAANDGHEPIRGRVIVSIASAWDYDPTSKHQIMRVLARDNKIVWVNYHGTRRPTFARRDVGAADRAIARFLRGAERVDENILQVTPLVLPGARRASVRRLHEWMLRAQVARAIRSVDPQRRYPLQIWSFAPDTACLAGAFEEECFVYYCVDEYSEFQDFDRERIVAAERATLRRADVVITTSRELYDTKRALHPNVHLVRHGVDFDHFAGAWQDELPRPSDMPAMAGPVFGFFGLIHHWIDTELIVDVAKRRPQYDFVLIGDCKVDVSKLRASSNVHLLGRRDYASLPAYCAAFDAALLPFVVNAMTRNVNPIKMYEYLAAGLPIISTPLPEAKRFSTAITFANDANSFARSCDRVLQHQGPRRREQIAGLVREESWHAKVATLCKIVGRFENDLCVSRPAPTDATNPPSLGAGMRRVLTN